jgi:hypothetical protein
MTFTGKQVSFQSVPSKIDGGCPSKWRVPKRPATQGWRVEGGRAVVYAFHWRCRMRDDAGQGVWV